MKVYCFDNDKTTENIIKGIIASNKIQITECHFNEKISNISMHSDSCSDTLAFVDTRIHGKKHNSFSLAMLLRERMRDCHIVFISAYPEDMVHCFKNLIRPSGFLLKPLSINEVAAVFSMVDMYLKKTSKSKTFHISTHDYKRNVEFGKIAYFSTSSKKIFCRMNDGERIEFYGTIGSLEKQYAEDFVRCHSGFLVNKQYIKGVRKGELELFECEETIPVSKRYRTAINQIIKDINGEM